MKNKIILIVGLSWLLFTSCSKHDEHAQHEAATSKYTCPMHPQIISGKPGTCPICGMDLVLVESGGNSNSITLTEGQMKLANVTTQKVSLKPIGETVVMNARLVTDQENVEVISSRAAGRVEKLFIKETGRMVKQGEPLYELYSETLLTLQREFVLAKEQYDVLGKKEIRYASFLKAAEQKLLLYGLSEKQIEKLAQTKSIQNRITFLAPASGVITAINTSEGQYISEGGLLYRIENINPLWFEAELYSDEITLIKQGDKVKIKITGYENTPIETSIKFLNPEFRANTQITVIRGELNNSDLKFKPGMHAQVFFIHASRKALSIPLDAVIHDGNGTHVYVQTEANTFLPRMVKTGLEDFEHVEIIKGLEENEVIAVSGAYLLYSELILKKGKDPMEGHHH